MDKRNKLNAAGCPPFQNSSPELEFRLSALESLVCELLRTNQELREALRKARPGLRVSDGTHPPAQRMETA